jgi:hypothetical protein
MPFIPHTPESLLPRSDSKNPAATCRGLTSAGRPCRRAIGGSPQLSKPSTGIHGPETYCWQHKDQAMFPTRVSPQGLQSPLIKERTSVDTLIDRLGLLEVSGQDGHKKGKKQPGVSQTKQKDHPPRSNGQTRWPRPKPKQKSNLALFCCISVADDYKRAPRPARSQDQSRTSVPVPKSKPEMRDAQSNHTRAEIPSNHISSSSSNLSLTQSRPPLSRDPSSRTAEFLSLIPKTATPQTASLLLSELAKPVSIFDEEGYIYMFWLTSESLPSAPPSESASSLLETPTSSARPPPGRRRTSEILRTFSSSSAVINKKILLKIGRASNVQRRLNEWTRQCGYNLSLVRYYPYQASSPSASGPSPTPRKVPHAHKVERLIHVELAGNRALESGKCANCGREHREWFEVDASGDGVRAVDNVIRRWVDWSLRNGS